jgi:hypothetical protein
VVSFYNETRTKNDKLELRGSMRYFVFVTLFLIFQTSHAQMLNLIGDRTLDSTKLEVKANCNFNKEVDFFYEGKKIVRFDYDGDSCQIHFDAFKNLITSARNSGKKVFVNTNNTGNTNIAISEIPNDPAINKATAKIKKQENISNGGR